MAKILFWVYLANLIALILHEMDSAYWREWEMFKLPGQIGFFLFLHVPLYFAGLYGLVLVSRNSRGGLFCSLALSAAGVLAFILHTIFLKKGRTEFATPASRTILAAALVLSLAQAGLTAALFGAGRI